MGYQRVRDRLLAGKVIPVLRLPSAELTERAIGCLLEVGFDCVEITMTTPDALELIARFSGRALVGAGTVLDSRAVRECIAAGAHFLVSPFVFEQLPGMAHRAGRVAMIAGFTPTEVLAADQAGADIVKVFPASTGGPAHLAHLHSVFRRIPLCPTGGVNLANLQAFFDAGASLVGVGNAIVPLDALERGDLDAVRAHAAAYLGKSLA